MAKSVVRGTLTAVLGVGTAVLLSAQEPQTPKFRVAVDAVRIDAVVTDKDGAIVRDLTADDFEVLQDGKPQAVTFAQFVPVAATPARRDAAAVPRSAPREGTAPAAVPAPVPVTRENIQRTIAIVVDDLGLSVESLYYVKRGLHNFIDSALQPGDLVALMRTGGSLDGLQPFTTDRRVLHAAVDNLKWNAFSRSGVEAFEAVNQFTVLRPDVPTGPGGESAPAGQSVGDFSSLNNIRNSMMAAGTLGSLNLVIEGARNFPGRKAVFFVSEGFQLLEKGAGDTSSQPGRVRLSLERAIDRATRAGVVVYTIDPRGLQTGGIVAADDFNCATPCPNNQFEAMTRDKASERNGMRRDTQESLTYLAEQTGGFAVLNNNDIGNALTRAAADVRDYYVIGYTPAADTFAKPGKTAEYHKIAVRVKRPGLKVRTRKEFLGVSDAEETDAAALSPAQQIVNAAISPFTATDIVIRATTLPGYDARGLFVRALLHIDASALSFVKGADGKSTASADVLGMVFDRDGTEVAHLSTGFEAALTSDAAQDALRDGLAYTLRIPIPRAGPYQIRFALRDRQSGKFGSAGEFLNLPDIPHGAFALSGIVIRSSDARESGADADRVVISPAEAVRIYKAGTQVKYAYEIYNATAPVRVALSVWRGAERVMTSAPDTLVPPQGPEKWFAARGAFKLGNALPPGRYVLEIAAATRPAGKTDRVDRAVQTIDFEVK